MSTVRLPGLIDVHTHMREPGGEHKETWSSGTAAAVAGGITTVLAMPNTSPAVVDEGSLEIALEAARSGARCDFAHYVGAALDNAAAAAKLADRAAGLKMYLGQTFGDLRLDDRTVWRSHLETWPEDRVIAVHAEGEALDQIIQLASVVDRSIHICHVSGGDDIRAVARAKERGVAVTCEATPHHLFLDQTSGLTMGRAEVRPRLGTPQDRSALWEHLETIDCFATDHAPHTIAEKDGPNPPPGFPGVETMLPLLLTAVHDDLLTLEDVVLRLHHRPVEIFGLTVDDDTWVEVDVDHRWTISAADEQSACGWTPFEGREVSSRVTSTVIRGTTVYEQGAVVGAPGTGRDHREGRH